jgi:protein-tyrosine phosphatase
MIGGFPPPRVFAKPPLNLLWLPAFDTFLTPIPTAQLARGVRAAHRTIQGHGRVLVYCHQGRHRSVVMASAILIAGGLTADQAMTLIKARRAIADPDAWYIRRQILRFERAWLASGRAEQPGFEELDV